MVYARGASGKALKILSPSRCLLQHCFYQRPRRHVELRERVHAGQPAGPVRFSLPGDCSREEDGTLAISLKGSHNDARGDGSRVTLNAPDGGLRLVVPYDISDR